MVVERRVDAVRLARTMDHAPEQFRIATFGGHGNPSAVVVRGRALDNPEPSVAVEGEGILAAIRRTVTRLSTIELPGVPLRISLAGTSVDTVTDHEGYFHVRIEPAGMPRDPWVSGLVGLATPYRGLADGYTAPFEVRVPGPGAEFGVISDIDDTILESGAQRLLAVVRRTFTGSALTRTPIAGAAELYRALTRADENPIFYVSSSPWNLHDFLVAFLDHRGFPAGPLLLRHLLGADVHRTHAVTKHVAIAEVLEMHPGLRFVLIGDSGQEDPEIYAEVIRRHPGRILAVYIREARLDPGDGRVEAIIDTWNDATPIVLAADSFAMAEHAASLSLITGADVASVRVALAALR